MISVEQVMQLAQCSWVLVCR